MRLHTIENSLVRLSVVALAAAVIYGVFAGAYVTMYYPDVPGMGSIEDRLGGYQGLFFVLAVGSGFIHIPRAIQDARNGSWKAAVGGLALFLAPVFVFVGTDGMIAHRLWWLQLSETDRYHILHHSLFAGVPLTALYAFAIRRWWRPAGDTTEPVKTAYLVIGGVIVFLFSLAVGVLFGAPIAGLILVGGLAVAILYSVIARK